MLKNNIFKFFFDYRGTLTRREYWAGLIFLLMLLILNIFSYNTLKTSNNFSFNFFQISEDIPTLSSIASINYFINNIFSISLPFSFITLYCCIVITLKRSKLLIKNRYIPIFMGIILFLLFNTMLVFILISINNTGIKADSSEIFVSFLKILVLFILLMIVSNLFIIIRLSKKTDNESEVINETKHSTLNTLFSIGKLILILFSFLIIVTIFFAISDDIKSLVHNQIYTYISDIANIIGAVVLIYILVKRTTDARIDSNNVYIPLLCYIFIYFTTIILPSIYDVFFVRFPFIYKTIEIILNYANMLCIIGMFTLIGLPSKKRS